MKEWVPERVLWRQFTVGSGSIESKVKEAPIGAGPRGGAEAILEGSVTGVPPEAGSKAAVNQWTNRRRRLLIGVLAVVAVAAVVFAMPRIRFVLETVSTDDAFVN